MNFKETLKEYKKKHKHSIASLAKQMDVSGGIMFDYLNGRRLPQYKTIKHILDVMGYKLIIVPKYGADEGVNVNTRRLPKGEMNGLYKNNVG